MKNLICAFTATIIFSFVPAAYSKSPTSVPLNEQSPIEITSLSKSLVLGKVEGSSKPIQTRLADGTYKTISAVNILLLDPSKPTQLVEYAVQTLSFSYKEDVFVRLDKEGVSLTETTKGYTLSVPRFGPGSSGDYLLVSPQDVKDFDPIRRDGRYYTAASATTAFQNKVDRLVVRRF